MKSIEEKIKEILELDGSIIKRIKLVELKETPGIDFLNRLIVNQALAKLDKEEEKEEEPKTKNHLEDRKKYLKEEIIKASERGENEVLFTSFSSIDFGYDIIKQDRFSKSMFNGDLLKLANYVQNELKLDFKCIHQDAKTPCYNIFVVF